MIYSVSVEAVFRSSGLSFLDAVRRSGELGYGAVEFWGWTDKDLEGLRTIKDELGLRIGSFCSKHGNLVDPNERERFVEGVRESVEAARRLECPNLIVTVGQALQEIPRERQRQSIVEGLKAAAPILEASGVTAVVEPLNTLVDHRGYFLEKSGEAFAIVDEVDSPRVKVLYDIYHQQISEGNLIPTIEANIERIGYFHIADHPGRGEIGSGEIHYRNVLEAIRKTGYDGFVGLEYMAKGSADEGLKKFRSEYAE
jgi:hydroxypyruvate isomerase